VKTWAALREWQVLAVADTKTAPEPHLELAAQYPNYHYLSVEEQKGMGYATLAHVPWKAYQRKIAGYLYAISRKARVIVETDDDNAPLTHSVDEHLLPEYQSSGVVDEPVVAERVVSAGLSAEVLTNVYGCYGRPELWPRGFPLSHLHMFVEEGGETEMPCTRQPVQSTLWTPVQQGLQDKDPDVDGIYRLINPKRIRNGVDFGPGQPLAMQVGQMCPFNTQNTAFYPGAFWGLLIPVDVTFRECDIVRGWWVQRILWDAGGRLLFRNSTVRHDRNSHDYYQDFLLEKKLYYEAPQFLNFLATWRSEAPTFEARLQELAQGLADSGHWSQRNADMMRAWIADLKSLNYAFPALGNASLACDASAGLCEA